VAHLAIATCSEFPKGDGDVALLAHVAEARGIEITTADWRDPSVSWTEFDAVLVRNTWDYTSHLDEFLAWSAAIPTLFNPASVIAWNTDKRYLDDLAAIGIPTITTTYLVDHAQAASFSWEQQGPFVMKPTVGAGSMGAERFEESETLRARSHAQSLIDTGKVVMVQPYLPLVETEQETAVILFDGWPSHAIAKGPMLLVDSLDRSRLFRDEQISARMASDAYRMLAIQTHAAVVAHLNLSGPLLYARVDMVPTQTGPAVIECEVTEPSLFLGFDPGAVESFVEALSRRLRSLR
jgi:glutathione synthase/RimK-type ligase-like ATP-grasp enzyme